MSIYVTSDLHFNHKNILQMCRTQFETIEEHNNYIIQQYNSVVKKDDLVYILGDIGFTPYNKLTPLIKQLNGRKILIIGNHDQGKDNEYLAMGFIEVIRHPVYYNSNIILSHFPVREGYDNPWIYNLHGHLHNNELTLKNYINVNIELNDYKPLDLKALAEEIDAKTPKSRYQSFGQEWFYEYYKNK